MNTNRVSILSERNFATQAVWLGAAFLSGLLVSYGSVQALRSLLTPSFSNVSVESANAKQTPIVQTSLAVGTGDGVAETAEAAAVLRDEISEVRAPLEYVLKSGDTLSKVWRAHGAPFTGAVKAAEALKNAGVALSSLRAGDRVALTVDGNDIVRLERRFRDGKLLILEGNSRDGYQATVQQLEIMEEEKTISGTIISSFSLAALDASVPSPIVDELVDLFGSRVEFRREVVEGDSFSVIYTERRSRDGEVMSPGPIVAASFKNRGKLLGVVRHIGSDGKARYYDEQGAMLGNYFLRYPLKFTRIASVFSSARFHPVLGVTRPHNGVDFAAPIGTPVRSVADGVVEVSSYRGGGGNTIIIRHNERYSTAYMHLSKMHVRPGQRVTRGETIGAVGMTGLSTGPHLHFGLFDRGRYVDPLRTSLPTLMPTGEVIPPSYLQAKIDLLERAHQTIQVAALTATGNAS